MKKLGILGLMALLPCFVFAGRLDTDINIGRYNPNPDYNAKVVVGKSIVCRGLDATNRAVEVEARDIQLTEYSSHIARAALIVSANNKSSSICKAARVRGIKWKADIKDFSGDLGIECSHTGRDENYMGAARFGQYYLVLKKISSTEYAGNFLNQNSTGSGSVAGLQFVRGYEVELRCHLVETR